MRTGRLTNNAREKKQDAVIEAMNQGLIETKAELSKLVGIDRNTLDRWLGDEEFVKKLERQRNKNWTFFMPKVDNALRNIAFSKDKSSVSAIRTIYEKRGEINGDTVRQPVTIVFAARSEGILKRPFMQTVENIEEKETSKTNEILTIPEKTDKT